MSSGSALPSGRIVDRAAFIRGQTRLHEIPHVPEIRLFVADEAIDIWEKTEQQLGEIGLPPPYWAFAWAGGQALARYILDHRELVRGRRVLDFAAGSGLVAIAAAMAGATAVVAADIDEFALQAIALNARENRVDIAVTGDDLLGRFTVDIDLILAGDIFYEKPTADTVLAWLQDEAARGIDVLIGDPGRCYLPISRLEHITDYRIAVQRSLEDADIKKTSVWRLPAQVRDGDARI
jgi:predicted nicotinamide N-methyase